MRDDGADACEGFSDVGWVSLDFKIGWIDNFWVFFGDSDANAVFCDALDVDVALGGYDVGDALTQG